MLKISKQSDYGLILTFYLYKNRKNIVSLSKLIEKTKLPKRFLARIASRLVRGGLLKSQEGKTGGYKVTDRVKKISFYDYLKIFEDDIQLTRCINSNYRCQFKAVCQHRDFLKNYVNKALVNELKKIKFLQLLKLNFNANFKKS